MTVGGNRYHSGHGENTLALELVATTSRHATGAVDAAIGQVDLGSVRAPPGS